jgi:putative glutamine amidotransferase
MIGVQWHPEYMPYSSSQRKLFAAFSDAVKASEKTLGYTEDE